MLRNFLIGLALVALAAGALFFQHKALTRANAEILMLQSVNNGLVGARKADAKTAQEYAGRVSATQRKNAELSRQILELQSHDKNTTDFLSMPIPGKLRDTINAYIGASAAAANQASMPAAGSATNDR